MQTIKQTIDNLHASLKEYIEATYHISSPSLIAQREKLLNSDGVIHRTPYLESTPKYQTGDNFSTMAGLPDAALEIFNRLSKPEGSLPNLIYDPPYKHQSESLKGSLIDGKNLIIMTGTGSGKTESFLLPILGKFAKEAKARPQEFTAQPAMRTLIMYPMNALVNDQLGRLRGIFGDPRVVETFKSWGSRPPRFARYTSRTPYAGVRDSKKDTQRLNPFNEFYIDILEKTESDDPQEQEEARTLLKALKDKGKWPAKPDMKAWFGKKGTGWKNKDGEYVRAVTLPDDSELLTRHEVQKAPPDLLVTNYSMLEYMLMRPVERSIFDRTAEWLKANPDETFLVVLDEAHLYRGASGAEVGLLLRRLRDRLGISHDRLQVICATASFNDAEYAPKFGAQLTGAPHETFIPIQGTLDLREKDDVGSVSDAEMLAEINLDDFYNADTDEKREKSVSRFLKYRGVSDIATTERALFESLKDFPPLGKLVNDTMRGAVSLDDLGGLLFDGAVPSDMADKAVTALMVLGSYAKEKPTMPSLLPCRIHNFFRGLPGLWACMDPDCTEINEKDRGGICGKIYSQPMDGCACGARILEFFTCRNCGTAYARAYTDNVEDPRDLWPEPGEAVRMAGSDLDALEPIDLLLENPTSGDVAEPADYDIETGQLNPRNLGDRTRRIYIKQDRLTSTGKGDGDDDEENSPQESPGKFIPCGVCQKKSQYGQSYVQDHQTKGDQPFQALLTRQIQIQPPNAQEATRFAPLRGRKVLAFSDSRQVAARLAPNVQTYSERDSLRPLIICGYKWLYEQESIRPHLSLDDLYLGVLYASVKLNVRLRPELHEHENFDAEKKVKSAFDAGEIDNPANLLNLLIETQKQSPPESLLGNMLSTLSDRFYGMEALALATLKEREGKGSKIISLPTIPNIAESDEEKLALARFWFRCWSGFSLARTPPTWIDRPASDGYKIRPKSSKTKMYKPVEKIIEDRDARKIFRDKWQPELLATFTSQAVEGKRCLNGSELSLEFEGGWKHCPSCKSVHRPIPNFNKCLDCLSESVRDLDPDTDQVFQARKGFYRTPVILALDDDPEHPPMSLIAAEHTAQLNTSQHDYVFSKAEENELLFQDIEIERNKMAIDILSSTTTMEVGIDLGALSGVALRNMPPSRANYQQRAGRAGRRGNAVATVVAFGSADSHDEHYFTKPDEMIRGAVIDPVLTLNNPDIAKRHIRAFLLQNYHQDRLFDDSDSRLHNLFSVLGSVEDFRSRGSAINRHDFEKWLAENEAPLRERIKNLLPVELSDSDTEDLLSNFSSDCLKAIDSAIGFDSLAEESDGETVPEQDGESAGQSSQTNNLLDRLLYCGILPRYAFPTDVATFHVFDKGMSTPFRHVMKFEPSQGLSVALSQYAPDKQVWISGKCYTSGAVYSTMKDERFKAWDNRRLYMECENCGFAKLVEQGEAKRGSRDDCPACGQSNGLGPAHYWFRPPGFAHPVFMEEATSPDDIPETSYATRAKLTMETPDADGGWHEVNDRIGGLGIRQHLIVSNSGPKNEGYNYCTKCGRIEASSTHTPQLGASHQKPYPAGDKDQICKGDGLSPGLVLGTDFITDIALFKIRIDDPITLTPADYSTKVAMRTVSEAVAKAACQILEVEAGEIMAEYRPALSASGQAGKEVEIFLYDTLPGGAGFSTHMANRGGELFSLALELLKNCPASCDASCYRCMRSFKNKFEHRLLDRHVGIELLEYLLSGQVPRFNVARLESAATLLLNDLQRKFGGNMQITANVDLPAASGQSLKAPILVEKQGKKYIIAVSGPLTGLSPISEQAIAFCANNLEYEFIAEDELKIRSNLPAASRNIFEQL